MVRLVDYEDLLFYLIVQACFNSTMVRLVGRSPMMPKVWFCRFNSTMVRLVVKKLIITEPPQQFQFHYGTIGRNGS